ncbi:MAG: PorV/PorQ family protein [Candidatus Eisenbacteria bacterium]|uniref:PorV/PorQ family protein n=1 Tax=Eiseniibacteriota bacterium TaxID=2212470 RepID=A0A538TVF2_UNCEI|nr:MAG: PorV/PorQ family protein [Candidatus Eisenbacteria bacterium]
MRTFKLCICAALVMALFAAGLAEAGIGDAGTTAANFLMVGSGARVLGMGGATLGLGDDIAATAWNPAALGWTGESEVVLSHAGLSNESLQEWMGIGGRVGKSQTRWSASGLYQGDGSIQGRDASNNPTSNFAANSFEVGAQVAQQLGGLVSLGIGAKSVNEKLGDATGHGFTLDAGLMIRQGMFGFGISGQNLIGEMKYDAVSYDFPRNIGVGMAVVHRASGLSLAMDANFPSAYYKDLRTGVEWMWKDALALRAGYRYEHTGLPISDPLSGPSFGIGAGKNGFWFDYGYLISSSGEGQHRVGLKFLPGRWSGLHSDPYGQGDIPRDFNDQPLIGPPTPKGNRP